MKNNYKNNRKMREDKAKEQAQLVIDKILSRIRKMKLNRSSFDEMSVKLNRYLRPGYDGSTSFTADTSPLSSMANKAISILNYLGNAEDCSWLKLHFKKRKIYSYPTSIQEILNQWLQDCEEVLISLLEEEGAGFYIASQANWADWYIQGCSCMKVDWRSGDENDENIIFYNLPMSSISIDAKDYGEIVAVAHEYVLQEEDAIDRFGIEAIYHNKQEGENILRNINNNDYGEATKPVHFVDICIKRDTITDWQKGLETPYVRLLINKDNNKIIYLQEEYTNPFIVSLVNCSAILPYGQSILWNLLLDLSYYNKLRQHERTGIEYHINPITLTSASFEVTLRSREQIKPGARLAGLDAQTLRPMMVNMPYDGSVKEIIQVRELLHQSLMDQMMASDVIPPNANALTATEVIRRELQWNKRILPYITHRKYDFFMPLVRRLLYFMRDRNILPEFPDVIEGISNNNILDILGVQFGGQLKIMTALNSLNNLLNFLNVTSSIGAGNILNANEIIREIAEDLNINAKAIKSEQQQMMEQQQMIEQQQMMEQ